MSGRGPSIRVPTRGGTITIRHALVVDVCASCPHQATLELDVDLHALDEERPPVPICGDCLAEALAVHIGAKYVADGGQASDLRWDDLEPLGPLG